jgi:ABC-type antimicrobial peptide transport system permease subunit
MSSGAGFPINDLMRRRLQTSLVIVTLTLSVASTLFLLLFSNRLGLGLTTSTGIFTLGLASVFNQFILFIGILVFLVGAVLTSFIVMLMMAQRTRDFGLIKAAGCPNSLVGGYFMTELLAVTTVGCLLGTVIGFFADLAVSAVVFGGLSLGAWWYAPIVFIIFFVLALFFGLQPIFKAAKLTAAEALSPANYYGLVITGKQKALSRSALTIRVASRSMVRRISPVARIVVLLSVVFVLLTVSVAGGIIAKDTTTSWVNGTQNNNAVAIAYSGVAENYEALLAKFTGSSDKTDNFNFSDQHLAIPDTVSSKIKTLKGVASVDSRLVLVQNVREIMNWTVIDGKETWVGGQREAEILVIGMDPAEMATDFVGKGRSLNQNGAMEAVISDSVSQTMYYPDRKRQINISDPLVEGMQVGSGEFDIVGLCVDPINNGYVAYFPVEGLINATGASGPNMLITALNDSIDRTAAIEEIRSIVQSIDPNLEVTDLQPAIAANEAFLGDTWQTIMFIPLLSLASAAICMVSYMMLSIDEQRQEFTVLRAIGAKPKIIINIAAFESAILLLSSFCVGTSFGVIITLMILMAKPIVTITTVASIVAWLVSALIIMFVLSLYPAVKLSKTGILQIGS